MLLCQFLSLNSILPTHNKSFRLIFVLPLIRSKKKNWHLSKYPGVWWSEISVAKIFKLNKFILRVQPVSRSRTSAQHYLRPSFRNYLNSNENWISLTTKERYHTTLFSFIIWAYYNHRGILRPEFSEQVDAVLLVPRSGSAQRKALWTLVLTQWLDKMESCRPELCEGINM